MKRQPIHIHTHGTVCGKLILGSFEDKLCLCDWESSRHPGRALNAIRRKLDTGIREQLTATLRTTIVQLDEYFNRERTTFDLPLLFIGTDFQKCVWQSLMEIPYGHTLTYGALAAKIGKPSAVRAVANANGANPLSIIAPCHRVIGSDGTLTGYGGGLEIKQFLLSLERNDKIMT